MCGIIGIINAQHAAEEIFLGLQNLQHRGQDGGGVVTLDQGTLYQHHGAGLLEIAFPPENFKRLKGSLGIGHTRYATIGKQDLCMLQPFVNTDLGLGVAHNGNIVNYHQVLPQFQQQLPEMSSTGCDSELILWALTQALKGRPLTFDSLCTAVQALSQALVGSYSVVGVIKGLGLFAFRDPNGLRPLVMGSRSDGAYGFASESMALEFLGFEQITSVAPGELVLITASGQISRQRYQDSPVSHCMFEWVYFARVESTLDDLPVYQARFQLGVALADTVKAAGLSPDIVVPVPETSRIAAIALAERLGVPFREVLIKNRYVNRTFILDSQAARLEAIRRKLYPVASELAGKKVLIVDDSIVRGNTAIKIIELLRKSGAQEIYMASTCPPIQHPCFYGIDFPQREELLAWANPPDSLAPTLGVDALVYQTLEGLRTALGGKSLCQACLTGEYPTDTEAGSTFARQRQLARKALV